MISDNFGHQFWTTCWISKHVSLYHLQSGSKVTVPAQSTVINFSTRQNTSTHVVDKELIESWLTTIIPNDEGIVKDISLDMEKA